MLKDIYFLTPEKSCSADAAVLCCVPSACPNDPWPALSERLAGVNINNRQSVSCCNRKPERRSAGLLRAMRCLFAWLLLSVLLAGAGGEPGRMIAAKSQRFCQAALPRNPSDFDLHLSGSWIPLSKLG